MRRPALPGERFLQHSLTVSELYVQCIEAQRAGLFELSGFLAEPAAWLRDGLGGWLKPDAYVVAGRGEIEDHWAVEVDKATEHLPTIRRKLDTYIDFMRRGQLGRDDVMPRVLFTVPNEQRRQDIAALVNGLPDTSGALFRVALESDAVKLVANELSA
ncbi:hypothetical protein Lesp02_29800 [Lentzea sp. NBRC 105346]|nr:hypothetical protein Lesp02_29800 [Lentzea sp. NBRC 105346]